ncbi:MAG: hypothetical protein ACM3O7_04910 [Acidobacteriota bacterium]
MPRSRPPEQLDIPLVWEVEREPPPAQPGEDPPPPEPTHQPCGPAALLTGAAADLGVTLLALALPWAIADALGASAGPEQFALIVCVGVELAAVTTVSCLWGWRGTPGMLLLKVGAAQPLPLARALRFWMVWFALLPVLAVPLAVGRRGRRLADQLAGSAVSCR